MPKPIIIEHRLAPGDITVMTALVRDIAVTYPGEYDIYTLTSCPSLWEHNPHIAGAIASPMPGVPLYKIDYQPYIAQANYVPLHFISAFHREFKKMSGVDVPITEPKPDLHLSQKERDNSPISGRYWLMFAGGKADATVKIWSAKFCQQVVDGLRAYGISVVQTGGTFSDHWHPTLTGVVNVLGQAGIRDTLQLIYHADGVMCPITWGMHAAAALERPCVVWAGGREHWWWEAYVNAPPVQNFGPIASGKVKVPHKYLHTQDLLPCCMSKGCWKNKVDSRQADKPGFYCVDPVDDGYGQIIPKCLKMITPEHVIQAVLSYYEDAMLPPIGAKPAVMLPDGTPLDITDPPQPITALPHVVGEFIGQSNFVSGENAKGERIRAEDPMDHATIGGRIAICTYLRGDDVDTHRRCLNLLTQTVPQHRRELRVATDNVETYAWLRQWEEDGYVEQAFCVKPAHPKYQIMRLLFEHVTAKYVVWLDHDTLADKDSQWWSKLVQTILNFHPREYRLFGPSMVTRLSPAQIELMATRPWWRQRNLRQQNGVESRNADCIHHARDSFFALSMELAREVGIPDNVLGEYGDWWIGAQVWQAGYDIKHWNGQKQFLTFGTAPYIVDAPQPGHAGWQPYED